MAIERDRNNRILKLHQKRHIDALVSECGLETAHSKRIPMITGVYSDSVGPALETTGAVKEYRSVLGTLNHLATHTRPDIAFAVGYLSRFQQAPTADKVARLRDVVLYLKGTADLKLHLGGKVPILHGFCDADFAQCCETRRSTTGLVVCCGLGPIAWRSKRQAIVSRSSTEAEYIAAGDVAKEIQHIHSLAVQFGLKPSSVECCVDNASAIALVQDPLSADRTKHIDVIYHHVRERVQCGQVAFTQVRSRDNVADIFTKPLGHELFQQFRLCLGIY